MIFLFLIDIVPLSIGVIIFIMFSSFVLLVGTIIGFIVKRKQQQQNQQPLKKSTTASIENSLKHEYIVVFQVLLILCFHFAYRSDLEASQLKPIARSIPTKEVHLY